ncbi:hypothetical protein COF81_28710 [Bacillus pseudomycoides]|uniref:Uncharacterized protein n=1 Tax=Bacillus pseudomycoides TaxID=64104 RepID=A0ABD6T0E2_9BACI|nr:hypothetical protein COF81_28710 [Bacillus pseudomycoides]
MQSLKMVKFNIWIFGILFITNAIEFISVLTTDHKFDWLKAFCAIGFFLVFIINLFDLKNKNYKTT